MHLRLTQSTSDLYKPLVEHLFLSSTENQGNGVFSNGFVPANTWLLKFKGQILKTEEISDFSHVLEIGDGLFLSASGEIDDFVNHSCEPNSAIIYEDRHPILYSIKDIKVGEQLTFDYSLSIRYDQTSFSCSCGASKCRGQVGPFGQLEKSLQDYYRSLGLVPDWLER